VDNALFTSKNNTLFKRWVTGPGVDKRQQELIPSMLPTFAIVKKYWNNVDKLYRQPKQTLKMNSWLLIT